MQQVPYRSMYPDAPREVWKHKGSDKEKSVRVVKLAYPNASVKDDWVKEEEVEEEEEGVGKEENSYSIEKFCLHLISLKRWFLHGMFRVCGRVYSPVRCTSHDSSIQCCR